MADAFAGYFVGAHGLQYVLEQDPLGIADADGQLAVFVTMFA